MRHPPAVHPLHPIIIGIVVERRRRADRRGPVRRIFLHADQLVVGVPTVQPQVAVLRPPLHVAVRVVAIAVAQSDMAMIRSLRKSTADLMAFRVSSNDNFASFRELSFSAF